VSPAASDAAAVTGGLLLAALDGDQERARELLATCSRAEVTEAAITLAGFAIDDVPDWARPAARAAVAAQVLELAGRS
jgi:hypothetical protein